ncbi:acyltransferase family protein [Nocardioides aequoreus]|uniref:acyltransferase family protein n=1 Tax=Nocardioides aequoreus TaxID=397278 RepID=UPI00068C2074|nr:acyltransferase [Nocardioides aequoreus]
MTTAPVTPTPSASTAGRTVYPLAWLRGLAALAVVTFHAYQHQRTEPTWEWPWSGVAHQAMLGTALFVEMFFVLSGFVLWLPVAKAALRGDTERPGWVLLFRRVARLLPLYLTVVLVVWAFTNPSLPGHWQDLVMHLTFTHVYSDDYIFWTAGPAWSLAVEFHFYALMALTVPLVQRAVRRWEGDRARLAAVLSLPVALTVGGLAYLVWMTTSGVATDNWSVLFSPMSRAACFGVGTGLAVLVATGVRLGSRARGALAVAGVLALVVLVLTRPHGTVMTEWWNPLYALAVAVALASIVLHDGPWPRSLDLPRLTWVGTFGYGVYLIHEPVMRLLGHWGLLPEPRLGLWFVVTAVLVAVPTVALAWLSSRTVEQAGVRLMGTLRRDGSPRDYYAHLDEVETDRERAPQPAAVR